MSVTFLAWLVALEAYKFANRYNGPHPDAHDATTKSYDADRTGPSPRLDQAKDADENGLSNAGTHPDRHAKAEDAKPDRAHVDAEHNNNHPVGSSTDPRILAEPLPSNLTSNTTIVGTSPALGFGFQGNSVDAPGALANQATVFQVAGATALQIDTTAPTASSVVASGSGVDGSGNGDLNAGHVVTLTVSMSEAVTVAGGIPTLSLNNGGTASYTGGSGSNALTFSYTVGAGEDTGDLAVTSFNLNGSTVSDAAGNSANVAGAVTNPLGILQIDTTAPTASSVVASGSGVDGSGMRSQCRPCRHADPQPERGGDGCRRHADADAQRRRHRHLYRRLRHQCADLQLHGGAGENTADLAATAVQSQRGDRQGRRR